ncbi:NAD(P)-dependent oxidoreductase [Rosenbergiella nectarea]|uniref:NAD(P)-dependent oxidoreductase n=1 Tax=Rosenbergiella nectarea TaxID=988801 RepID=UPI001BDAEB27|nr:NAD(P)-dependent oxidoreductase [Rosenbergiella nectarea]MBT0728744.1 NAD(P)-dependent oxidoreductase [Rosenbergiella nectarea subsp. apis]
MVSVAVVGASGQVGSRIVKELSQRGHKVTAIARQLESIPNLPNVSAVKGDITDTQVFIDTLAGHEVVVSAVKFAQVSPETLIDAVKASNVSRYLVVGGAGSLEVAPGQLLIDQPDFPEAYRQEARAGLDFLNRLREEKTLDWTFISPSALFEAGERTGNFRLGRDTLLSNEQGSRISYEDYAIALVDEIEHPAHSRQRFTVGY